MSSRPTGASTTLTWDVDPQDGLDVLHLGELIEDLHGMVCGNMPGQVIREMHYSGDTLTITVGPA